MAADSAATEPPDSSAAAAAAPSDSAAAAPAPKPSPVKDNFTRISEGLVGASMAAGTVLVAIVIWQLVIFHSEPHVVMWSVAGIFVGASLPISLHTIHMHLAHYVSPLQRFYLRILWLVPIYGVESWLSLRFHEQAVYIMTLRELYEAFVIHAFFTLMLTFLDEDEANLKRRLVAELGERLKVCCCGTPLDYWSQGGMMVNRCKLGVFQYVFVKCVFAVATLGCAYTHCLGESMYDYKHLEPYSVIAINASQMYALWCLGIFYWEVGHRVKWLTPIQPVKKFLVVKAIVFLAWWQSLGIEGLVYIGVIKAYQDYSVDEVAVSLQDFLICVEMFLFAIAHHWAFNANEFQPGGCLEEHAHYAKQGRQMTQLQAIIKLLPTDILREGQQHVLRGGGLVHKMKKSSFQGTAAEMIAADDAAREGAGAGVGAGSAGSPKDGEADVAVEVESPIATLQLRTLSLPPPGPPPPPPTSAPPPPPAAESVPAA